MIKNCGASQSQKLMHCELVRVDLEDVCHMGCCSLDYEMSPEA